MLKTIKVYVSLDFKPPGTKTTLAQFLEGLQRAFKAWSDVCNVKWQLIQSPRSKYYTCPVKIVIFNNKNVYANISGSSKGRGKINISNAPNKANSWDRCIDFSYKLMVHELGHILGLKDWQKGDHPESIMNWGFRPYIPGLEDIQKVQKIWGKV